MKKGEVYKGAFLKAEHLKQGNSYTTRIVTIAGLRTGSFDDGNEQRIASFHECEEELGLNVTNWDTLDAMSGNTGDDDNFVGLRIELYVDPTVRFKGKLSPAIRIRKPQGVGSNSSTKPAASTAGADSPPPPDDSGLPEDPLESVTDKTSAWVYVFKSLTTAGRSKDDIVKSWNANIRTVGSAANKTTDQFDTNDWRNVVEACEIPF